MSANVCKPLKMCADCGTRKALFRAKGPKANTREHTDREHNLCRRCWRNLRNKLAGTRRRVSLLRWAYAGLLMVLLATGASAQTTTIIGTVKDLTGSPVTGGQVTFELRPGGDTTISGNGRFTPQTVTCTINQSNSFNASTGLTRAANTVTVVFTNPHSFLVGDSVVVTGMSNTSFNGTFTIATVADTTHVTWSQTAANAQTGGGIISALRAAPGPGACTLIQNTALQPAGTSYLACLWPQGSRTACFNFYAIGIGPVDISTTVPTPGNAPAYAFVDTFNNQTIGGNKTWTGTTIFQGPVQFPTGFALSGVFSTATALPATVGVFRAANNENALCMRNAANSANLCFVLDASNVIRFNGNALATGGTVTTTSIGNFSPLFNASVANPTTTPAFSFAAISQNQNLAYASPCGSSGNPTFRALCATDFTTNFPSSANANGYIQLWGGITVEWGTDATVNAGTCNTENLPQALSNTPWNAQATAFFGNGVQLNQPLTAAPLSNTQLQVCNNGVQNTAVFWQVIGPT